jgi:uncharacterized membrane protein
MTYRSNSACSTAPAPKPGSASLQQAGKRLAAILPITAAVIVVLLDRLFKSWRHAGIRSRIAPRHRPAVFRLASPRSFALAGAAICYVVAFDQDDEGLRAFGLLFVAMIAVAPPCRRDSSRPQASPPMDIPHVHIKRAFERLPVLAQSALYSLRGGFLIRPLAIALVLGVVGATLSAAEETVPSISDFIPGVLFPSHQDATVAQLILSSIATSIMTVVSIVFAILLMTLTLASTQFSPRILISFVRDRTTQWTLGVFLGTFSYCMAALPAARSMPHPFAPVVTVTGAMMLALICVGWLIYFINHISQSISVNHIVDRIARETEEVIGDLMPEKRGLYAVATHHETPPPQDGAILSRQSGYIRYIDIKRLVALAQTYRIYVHIERRVGQFIPSGLPLAHVAKADRIPPEYADHFVTAFDIGPTRTLQQDVEFGMIQIVDIALRAMSPAVNDPSTAISCIDQLSRIMIAWIGRRPPVSHYYAPPHVPRLYVPWMTFDGLLDTAFEQIRHYAAADAAVSLRLIRALADIASTADQDDVRAALFHRAQRVADGCQLPKDDFARVQQRLAGFEAVLAREA